MNARTAVIAMAICATLVGSSPANAAGCIKGAIVGGLAAHVTHHSTLLGALGGCLVGKVVAHYTGSLTFQDVTGRMLGSDAELGQVGNASKVSIVKASSLKGYKSGDLPLSTNGTVGRLDSEIAANPGLTAALQKAGYAATDVIAVTAKGGDVLFVNA
jgi:hypothetical protein